MYRRESLDHYGSHFFHAPKPIDRMCKHISRDPGSVNAMKQTCVVHACSDLLLNISLAGGQSLKWINLERDRK